MLPSKIPILESRFLMFFFRPIKPVKIAIAHNKRPNMLRYGMKVKTKPIIPRLIEMMSQGKDFSVSCSVGFSIVGDIAIEIASLFVVKRKEIRIVKSILLIKY